MSFDLMAFDKSLAPSSFDAFLDWSAQQTSWSEERDYNSTDGTSAPLVAWFTEIRATFPPLNGPYAPDDDVAFATRDSEAHLTDYSIGSAIIYAAFAYSVAAEAEKLAPKLAEKHGVGFYNPQTGEIICDGMVTCKIHTERGDEVTAVWEQIERELNSLDSAERGTGHRSGAFITMRFDGDGSEQQFMQCMPDYPKPQGVLKRLFGGKEPAVPIESFTAEVCTGEKILTKQYNKAELTELFRTYYKTQTLPDTSGWTDSRLI